MISKLDYSIAALIGFLAGVFLIPTLINVGLRTQWILMIIPLVIPPVFALGVWISGILARRLAFMAQFGKFVAVGFLNTAIDFGILNLLSMATGITSGFVIGGVNAPGFAVAVINSYFWNQLWVFKGKNAGEGMFHDFPKFLTVMLIGLAINSGIIFALTTYIMPPFGLGETLWLNVSKAFATIFVLVWNFLGLKFLVFRP
ncbi:MAG: GtrA family protein [Candidatus Sungbacteria bacterium]|nr:GtrA family protein [Candidatus Sungbacteria bacterium]